MFIVVQSLSHVQLFVTPWTRGHQASLCFTISQSLLDEGMKGKRGQWEGLDLHMGVWGTEAQVRWPHQGNCLEEWRRIWGRWRVQQLICDSLNGMRTTQTNFATALCTLDRDASPLECAVAGNWSVEFGQQSQCKVCCWLQGESLRGCDGEDPGGKCFWREVEAREARR